jgi:hypothetical protein
MARPCGHLVLVQAGARGAWARVLLSRESRSRGASGRDGHLQRRQRRPIGTGFLLRAVALVARRPGRDTERATSQENVELLQRANG